MNLKTSGIIAVITVGLLSLNACKKEETKLLTTADNLVGSWELNKQGSDINGNHFFDANEKNELVDTAVYTYQLKKDGTGYKVGFNNTYVDTLNWKLVNNEAQIEVTVYNQSFTVTNTYDYTYNSSFLQLQDKSVSPDYFFYFIRKN